MSPRVAEPPLVASHSELVAELFEAAMAGDDADLLGFVARRIAETFGDVATIHLVSPDRRGLERTVRHAVHPEREPASVASGRIRLEHGIGGYVRSVQTPFVAAAPLASHDTPGGVVEVTRTGRDRVPFTPRERRSIERVAAAASLILENGATRRALREEAAHKRLLAEFFEEATKASGDERAILRALAEKSAAIAGGSGIVYLLTEDRTWAVVAALASLEKDRAAALEALKTRTQPGDAGLMGEIVRRGTSLFIPAIEDAAALPFLTPDRRQYAQDFPFSGLIAVPLRVSDEIVGAVAVSQIDALRGPFDRGDLEFVESLAASASLVLEKNRAHAQRDSAAARFEAVTTESPIPTVLFSSDGRIEVWNRAAEELFGWTADEVIGLDRNPWVPDEAAEEAAEFDRRGRAGEVIRGAEVKRRRKDGSAVDLLFYQTHYRGSDGSIAGFVVRVVDITDRKRLERELRHTSDTLGAILEASPLAIVALDEELRVTFWNPMAERLYGWTAEEVMGKPVPQTIPEDPTLPLAIFERLRAGETVSGEGLRSTKAGGVVQVHFNSAPLRDEGGRFRGALTVQEDIAERKRLEAELLQAQKMETVGRLAGGVAHDFNNILTAIIGYSDLAASAAIEPDVIASLTTIRAAAERASGLTHQLLAFSRRQMLQPQILDANEAVLGMESILRRLIGEDIELVMSVAPTAGALLADRTQLEQVILNLAVNARDAMPRGGRLVIRTDYARFEGVWLHPEMSPGEYVLISVSDTGIGMNDETKLHIFEPFFTTKEVGKGTGLGLATSYGIVRQSGGYIFVQSEPDRGSTFRLYFPRVSARPPGRRHEKRQRRERRGRILLVEDEPVLRELARLVLVRDGFEVVEAQDAMGAVAIGAEGGAALDLLVTDVVMPGMGGVELARRLQAERPELRVLFMSGYSQDLANVPGASDHGFLAKPFTPDSLLHAVDEAMSEESRRS